MKVDEVNLNRKVSDQRQNESKHNRTRGRLRNPPLPNLLISHLVIGLTVGGDFYENWAIFPSARNVGSDYAHSVPIKLLFETAIITVSTN